ncbi:MAG: hypothetical protein ACHQZQ_04245 [SAR324 cluster bacterium]
MSDPGPLADAPLPARSQATPGRQDTVAELERVAAATGTASRAEVQRLRSALEPGRPRVLYVLWHYPQLSETYIESEMRCMRRWGCHIEAW